MSLKEYQATAGSQDYLTFPPSPQLRGYAQLEPHVSRAGAPSASIHAEKCALPQAPAAAACLLPITRFGIRHSHTWGALPLTYSDKTVVETILLSSLLLRLG